MRRKRRLAEIRRHGVVVLHHQPVERGDRRRHQQVGQVRPRRRDRHEALLWVGVDAKPIVRIIGAAHPDRCALAVAVAGRQAARVAVAPSVARQPDRRLVARNGRLAGTALAHDDLSDRRSCQPGNCRWRWGGAGRQRGDVLRHGRRLGRGVRLDQTAPGPG